MASGSARGSLDAAKPTEIDYQVLFLPKPQAPARLPTDGPHACPDLKRGASESENQGCAPSRNHPVRATHSILSDAESQSGRAVMRTFFFSCTTQIEVEPWGQLALAA